MTARPAHSPVVMAVEILVAREVGGELGDLELAAVVLEHGDRAHVLAIIVIVQAHLDGGGPGTVKVTRPSAWAQLATPS